MSTGAAVANNVNQTPTERIKNLSESLEIQCSHSIQTHNTILWYKQTRSGTLTFMGNLVYKASTIEAEFVGKVQMNGNADTNERNSLAIRNLSLL